MSTKYTVTLQKMIDDLSLTVLYTPTSPSELYVTSQDVNRPGLELAGFDDYYDPERLQFLGLAETEYIKCLEHDAAVASAERLVSKKPPALIITRGIDCAPILMESAQRHGVPVLSAAGSTSDAMSATISYLGVELAPRITRHGVLVEVYGEGVLILGDSGVGKSETALELIKRGHRLIADDAVEIRRVSNKSLVGAAPDNIRHFIELRGVGILNARRLFGMGAVKLTEKIDMVVQLEAWDSDKVYDRLGLESEYTEILGISVPITVVPVKPGRNLSIIIEAAAMNNRQKKMGYNAARELLHSLGMTDDIIPDTKEVESWHSY